MSLTIDEILKLAPVVPVIVIEDLEDAVPLAQALYDGGLKVLEITLRTPVALDAIKAMVKALPEDAVIGSGTVVTPEDLQASIDAGCKFMVSPGTTPALIEAAKKSPIPLLPGIASPSEAMNLYTQGFKHLKFFPAEAAGGVPMVKSIGGPLPQITFCPTGGINLEKAPTYLALPNVACVGGTWTTPKNLITEKKWDDIEALAREAASLER
ncbi:bifunctional 4-hydroxy-2-oxoglutarate aldolase/2-dehydro-3-deoxy-phosphogluconate aldolase [Gilvimarinus agarilyticus]|uniref:bifunctional 4-hydroxy-2-oxoglutarate aldolase/2-dehydro-3-deoxy-phosphogluconate aldolase n=1 Tax=unclassified Gilvimarinus TaxID=2642066 RepID=UPI001C08AB43|nr:MULTISPECIES: bifunctional 4-hydroxy-2-oxoglutarate aldolase/2-dehydro-3-deoxy-phosphogluconate aldolase [unclassified Gilvimarinus]MBU2886456.1 bifunctional 4-hydroxy-2-oxoglutarate aldolase/2-dehydro-3-deoxy-phosphogluconate aldolase [Gilvimarinus agarilyticus]MDO6571135.1 bifunctional 4-hydroxy-2-oxoglutarate aldolase/2-dehydro-3-deoxy-phosphogluconate aldolase [Gilvimarinus sp. 2_MG-2023]MDO6745678.1 bifunctional 4-hydroxy-2-oxoglutarate aldolase/2-dehydro-3-deoxy-phosphogluconate aldolas